MVRHRVMHKYLRHGRRHPSQPVTQRVSEGVACPQPVGDVDKDGRRVDAFRSGASHYTLRLFLDDREFDAAFEQRIGGTIGVGLTDGDTAFFEIADG